MKKKDDKAGSTLARATPPLPEIIMPTKPVAMNGPEYDQLMRLRIRHLFIEMQAEKVKH